MQEQEPEERTGRRIRRDSFEEDSDSEDEEFNESPATSEFHEEETEDSPKYVVSTRLYGNVHFKTAENLLLNGGKTSINTQSRTSRFECGAFGVSSDIRIYFQPDCRCSSPSHIKIGDVRTLPTFKPKECGEKWKEKYAFFCTRAAPCSSTV
jgi:hypothetical protein